MTRSPSLGARIWVTTAKQLADILDLLPDIDRSEATDLLVSLWSKDPEESAAAEKAFFEAIDNPDGKVVEF